MGKRWRVHQVSAGLVSEQSLSPLRFEVQLLHQEVGLDGDLVTLHNQLAEQGRELLFATNGGMYHPDRMPVGLWIHGGETLSPLNVHSGEGNFFLRPNGVFALCSDRFVIQETHHFATELSRKSSPCHERRVREATQSGPLLLRNGQRHPKLKAQSQSRKRRNGVGIDAEGNALLVLSEDDVTLFELLRVFEELRCSDALYLDGVVSSLYEPGTQHLDRGRGLGPVIFVTTST